jgi:O-antigen/teichoic acid export membrane protein
MLGFLGNLLLANILAPFYYGTVSLLVVNAAIISLVTGLGIEGYITHAITNKKWDTHYSNSIVWTSIAIQICLFVILQIISIACFGVTILSRASPSIFFLELIYFSGIIITEKIVTLFYAMNKARVANMLLLFVSGGYVVVLLFFYFIKRPDYFTVLSLIAFQAFIQSFTLILAFICIYKPVRIKWVSLIQLLRTIRISFIILISNVVQFVAYRVDFLILKKYHSNYEVGMYAQANKFANLIWIVPNIVVLFLVPKLSQVNKNELAIVFRWSFFLNIVSTLATVLLAHFCYIYLLSPEYSVGISAFHKMLPGYFAWALVTYFGAYFSWSGHFRYNLYGSCLCLISILMCDFLLIPAHAINGAAISNTIAYCLTLGLYLLLYYKHHSTSLKDLVSVRSTDIIFLKKLMKE